jgi:hypothetical protein
MAAPQRIIPPGITFEQALRFGYTGRICCDKYIAWLKKKPCDSCGAPAPSDPSHLDNGFKGTGTKSPDLWAIPECRSCHELYERAVNSKALVQPRMARAALYMLWAWYEGVFE